LKLLNQHNLNVSTNFPALWRWCCCCWWWWRWWRLWSRWILWRLTSGQRWSSSVISIPSNHLWLLSLSTQNLQWMPVSVTSPQMPASLLICVN